MYAHQRTQKAWRWRRTWAKHLQKLVVEGDARGYTPGREKPAFNSTARKDRGEGEGKETTTARERQDTPT